MTASCMVLALPEAQAYKTSAYFMYRKKIREKYHLRTFNIIDFKSYVDCIPTIMGASCLVDFFSCAIMKQKRETDTC